MPSQDGGRPPKVALHILLGLLFDPLSEGALASWCNHSSHMYILLCMIHNCHVTSRG